jgi:hypothetical protein
MTQPRALMTRSQLCHAAGALQAQRTALQRRQKLISDEIKDVHRAISALDAADIMVSDHAVVRWLERQKGLDLEAVRAEIAAVAQPHIGTAGTVPLGNGLVMLIDGNRVVTIMPAGEKA